jgi:hypothetical protein
MPLTEATLSTRLSLVGWTLERTPVNAASEWHRWLVCHTVTGDLFRFTRLDVVDRSWLACVQTHMAIVRRGEVVATWLDDAARRDAVEAWLASPDARLLVSLREPVRLINAPPLPARWRTHAARLGQLAPPGGHDLRSHVRAARARAERARLERVCQAYGKTPAMQRL